MEIEGDDVAQIEGQSQTLDETARKLDEEDMRIRALTNANADEEEISKRQEKKGRIDKRVGETN